MAPEPVTSPERRFVITRFDADGVESNAAVSALLPANFATDAAVRSTVYATARSTVVAHPGVRCRIYSPSNVGPHTDDDCIWDSAVNTELP